MFWDGLADAGLVSGNESSFSGTDRYTVSDIESRSVVVYGIAAPESGLTSGRCVQLLVGRGDVVQLGQAELPSGRAEEQR